MRRRGRLVSEDGERAGRERVAILGGGPSGLTAAYWLTKELNQRPGAYQLYHLPDATNAFTV